LALRVISSHGFARSFPIAAMTSPSPTEYREFPLGVPQGSILSPLLFLIFVADCAATLSSFHAEFADDITLWYSSDSIEHTFQILNADLRRLELWAKTWGLNWSLPKCTFSVFSRNRHWRKSHVPDLLPKLRFCSKVLKVCLNHWWLNDSPFEPVSPSNCKSLTRSFYGCAYQAHIRLLKCYPALPARNNPIIPPPWLVSPLDLDSHGVFRSKLRQAIRVVQVAAYNADSNGFFKSLHPSHEPLWPHSVLRDFRLSKIIFRLRSGFCDLGAHRHHGPQSVTPCQTVVYLIPLTISSFNARTTPSLVQFF
jgi:hypothetical protein